MAEQQRWDVLAARFHRNHPRVHVPQMAKVVEVNLDGSESRPLTRRGAEP